MTDAKSRGWKISGIVEQIQNHMAVITNFTSEDAPRACIVYSTAYGSWLGSPTGGGHNRGRICACWRHGGQGQYNFMLCWTKHFGGVFGQIRSDHRMTESMDSDVWVKTVLARISHRASHGATGAVPNEDRRRNRLRDPEPNIWNLALYDII
jgi:hypothetical protein